MVRGKGVGVLRCPVTMAQFLRKIREGRELERGKGKEQTN